MTGQTPFSKLLVANRGEVALRIIRTAREMGYRTVAVYSSADRGAPHVRAADQAVRVGESEPAASYLNITALIEAARKTGADAVHPGYGFLAESDEFARACVQAGLVFVGPSAHAIRSMGDKAEAKALMIAAGVPCIPGYQGEDQSDETLARKADRLGFPLMIKAVAGGGGRGLRLVESGTGFADALRSARSEAAAAFARDDVMLERALRKPRHIEIQVFADRYGQCVHLGERDCSVQRRHQKLIEEAPSPVMTDKLRTSMGDAAIKAVQAISYEGAGTLEFLLDSDGNFYFMEMNTRLQVEHPVTEAVTGLDLVEWQLRIAAGEPLPLAQSEIRFDGHAIEVRLCAEDASNCFMPQSGVLRHWHAPPELRVEHALEPDLVISPFYDSMIAKLIAHGRTRAEAIRKLSYGLEQLVAIGITTNQAFLAGCLANPVFQQGLADTGFIAEHQPQLPPPSREQTQQVISMAAVLFCRPAGSAAGRRPAHRLPMELRLALNGDAPQEVTVVQVSADGYEVRTSITVTLLELTNLSSTSVRFSRDGVEQQVNCLVDNNHLWLNWQARVFAVADLSRVAASRGRGPGSADGTVRASTGGRVVAVTVETGQAVHAGQPLVSIEAMKMEHAHLAPADGVVVSVSVAVGDQVPAAQSLMTLDIASPVQSEPSA